MWKDKYLKAEREIKILNEQINHEKKIIEEKNKEIYEKSMEIEKLRALNYTLQDITIEKVGKMSGNLPFLIIYNSLLNDICIKNTFLNFLRYYVVKDKIIRSISFIEIIIITTILLHITILFISHFRREQPSELSIT